ncbi:MAG: hypothetical protein IPN74_10740 [Haliscomenobacter sp.]|nr:hypothetical protein [Haliscomenobacter sp.]MBK8878998.1 hypothetical protein [Haliscomenobacter sp.]
MEEIIIQLKDQSKRSFLLELLAQFDFLELAEKKTPERAFLDEGYDFFESAGLFEGRDISADKIRREAWQIKD